jgi:hypothetical protein
MKSEEFDRAFDDGEDVTSQLDMSGARRPGLEQRRVNVDFPAWMIESLDREARRLGGEPPVDHQGLDRRAPGARSFGSLVLAAPACRGRPAWSVIACGENSGRKTGVSPAR